MVKPILFNTEMVRAILDGRKTVTRRCVKFLHGENPNWTGYIKDGLMLYNGRNEPCCKNPPYKPGDILYVRETFVQPARHIFWYKADDNDFLKNCTTWRTSIHMPKEAARIWLKVTDVRVERLQEITDEQAEKEGCCDYTSTSNGFCHLWDSTIKKSDLDCYGWNANPWVWVIEFERCEKPENLAMKEV